jgi:hypothetical protein
MTAPYAVLGIKAEKEVKSWYESKLNLDVNIQKGFNNMCRFVYSKNSKQIKQYINEYRGEPTTNQVALLLRIRNAMDDHKSALSLILSLYNNNLDYSCFETVNDNIISDNNLVGDFNNVECLLKNEIVHVIYHEPDLCFDAEYLMEQVLHKHGSDCCGVIVYYSGLKILNTFK